MEIRVNPTRMELLRLKKRLVTAVRGHKLLKDKLDELMKNFLELVEENQRLRTKVEEDLAQVEKTVELMAAEIERTRRRVNALEYVLIPQLQEQIKYITMKLDENERSNLTRLMKVKEMVRNK